jgi:dihydroneopterin aldolase/2-amino-4-hydroxy-6-hydroxymethyldihydropteridine diphosphokinase/dihydropteroate synthase
MVIDAQVQIRTTLEPLSLLYLLKETEMHLGRTRTFKNGPRVVDLDILLFDDLVYNNTPSKGEKVLDLIIPHIRMQEREFVLRPLAEYVQFLYLFNNCPR